MAVTDARLKSAKMRGSGSVSVKIDRDGLSIRISAKGKLTFQMRYYYLSKAKRLDIGTYPKMSLKQRI